MVATAYGTDFIHVPEQKRIYITQTGGPHSFRPIFMDGRPHPKDLDPSYYGHSVGHWEGDTLVIDTIGFNERSWIDFRGLPTTEALHLTERIARPDFNTLRYEMTIDDPGAYTSTVDDRHVLPMVGRRRTVRVPLPGRQSCSPVDDWGRKREV